MNSQIINANQRFSVLNFGAGRNEIETEYSCPTCSNVTMLTADNFSQSLFNSNSVLASNTVIEIEKIRPIKLNHWEDYFDFECTECKKSVRVIHSPNEFRMACHNFLLKEVIEVNQN